MSKKIMIVDDDPQLRAMYKAALEMRDYEVTMDIDGEAALNSLIKDKFRPDLILLDVMMPKMHGLEVLDVIKHDDNTKDIKVIMLSAVSDEDVKIKAANHGAYSYIVKSEISMADVIEKIEETLNS